MIAVTLISAFFSYTGLDIIYLLILLAFFVMTTVIVSRQVLFSGEVTGNKIIGIICIFLLLGLIWSTLYLLLLEQDMSSFSNLTDYAWYDNFSKMVYFSFMALTLSGSADITPALPVARFLAYLEAVMGL